jgi:hypothetical protein
MGVKQLVFTFAVVIGLVPRFLFDRIILCVLDRLILLALGGPVIDFGFHTNYAIDVLSTPRMERSYRAAFMGILHSACLWWKTSEVFKVFAWR